MEEKEFCNAIGNIFSVRGEILNCRVIKTMGTGEVQVFFNIRANESQVKRIMSILINSKPD